ncbi:MAG: hypothetical protein ACR2FG_11930 [Marmoricola sp.]
MSDSTPPPPPEDPYTSQAPSGPPVGGEPPSPYGTGQPPPPPPQYGAPPAHQGKYNPTEAIGYGWTKFTKRPAELLVPVLLLLVAVGVVFVIVYGVLAAVFLGSGGFVTDPNTGVTTYDRGPGFIVIVVVYALLILLSVFVGQLVGAGLVKGGLDSVDGKPVSIGEMFQGWDKGQALVAAILIAVGIGVGYVLCFIPAIIVGFLTQYTMYYVVDQKLGAVDAIKASVKFTTSNLGDTIIFYLLAVVGTFVGSLLCGLGLLVALPVVLIGQAYTFRRLNAQPVAALPA